MQEAGQKAGGRRQGQAAVRTGGQFGKKSDLDKTRPPASCHLLLPPTFSPPENLGDSVSASNHLDLQP